MENKSVFHDKSFQAEKDSLSKFYLHYYCSKMHCELLLCYFLLNSVLDNPFTKLTLLYGTKYFLLLLLFT